MKDGTEKLAGIFITILVVAQGLYVVFPLPDIWPLSNYSMFSRAGYSSTASKHEIYGVTEDGRKTALDHPEAFSPLDRVRLRKGINRILHRRDFVRKQEKRVESILGHLDFLPVDRDALKETVRKLLPYKDAGAVSDGDREKDLRVLLDYLISRYESNRVAGIHDGPPVTKLNLYKIAWDWTEAPPEKVVPRIELIYSEESGLIDGEK